MFKPSNPRINNCYTYQTRFCREIIMLLWVASTGNYLFPYFFYKGVIPPGYFICNMIGDLF
jgi:hypothetical protein